MITRALYVESRKEYIRWSMKSLLQQGESSNNGLMTSNTSKTLLSDATTRLAHQHDACKKVVDLVKNLSVDNQSRRIFRQLDLLLYVHEDTFKIGYNLVKNDKIWSRFSEADRHLLAATAEQLRSRHARTMEIMAEVTIGLRAKVKDMGPIEKAIDRFLKGRLGVQLLCDHYVKLNKGNITGGIAVDCPMKDLVNDAATEASSLCDANLQVVPETIQRLPTDLRITTVRPWIHHTLVEVLKNAMASTVMEWREKGTAQEDPAEVAIRASIVEEEAIIDVIDRGTGLLIPSRRKFDLGHSSVEKRWDRIDEQQSYASVRSPLSSLGVGLHSSRSMMEHFGGSLDVFNNKTHSGCTARITLPLYDGHLESASPSELYRLKEKIKY